MVSRTLRNALVDHWRRRAAEARAIERVGVLGEDPVSGVDAELEETVCGCAAALIATLKPQYAEALRRVDLGGQSVKSFAEETGITATSASVRLFRGRQALREQVRLGCGTCAGPGCLNCSCSRGKPQHTS